MNGAEGISDIEGKATRVGASERGQRTSFNGAEGISDIEGKVTRVGASERGQRMSFKPRGSQGANFTAGVREREESSRPANRWSVVF